MENAQERLDSLNESIKRLTEAVRIAFEPIDSSILDQVQKINRSFESITQSIYKNFPDPSYLKFKDVFFSIDKLYRMDIFPAISRIEFPENFEPSPISEDCMEKLSDIADALPDQLEEKSKLFDLFKKAKEHLTLSLKVTLVIFLVEMLWNLFVFTWEQTHPQQGDIININIDNVNIVEINSQNEDVISEDNRELAEKILDVISELTENIDDINGDIVSGGIAEPDRLDSVENDVDE